MKPVPLDDELDEDELDEVELDEVELDEVELDEVELDEDVIGGSNIPPQLARAKANKPDTPRALNAERKGLDIEPLPLAV